MLYFLEKFEYYRNLSKNISNEIIKDCIESELTFLLTNRKKKYSRMGNYLFCAHYENTNAVDLTQNTNYIIDTVRTEIEQHESRISIKNINLVTKDKIQIIFSLKKPSQDEYIWTS